MKRDLIALATVAVLLSIVFVLTRVYRSTTAAPDAGRDHPVEVSKPAPVVSEPAVVRTPAPSVDTESLEEQSIALRSEVDRLSAENTRLTAQLDAVKFASTITTLDSSVNLAQVMDLLDKSYLSESPELRAQFSREVNVASALVLLRAEPNLRADLARMRNTGDDNYCKFQWPVDRDLRILAFVSSLADAGLSSRFIESYRLLLADYL